MTNNKKYKNRKPTKNKLSEKISESKNLGGRPPKEFIKNTFEQLCKMQCTTEEIAAAMGFTRSTLYTKVQEAYKSESFKTVYDELRTGGHVSLRRAQWESAVKKGNVSMQKFLGEQYLGQASVTRATVEAEIKQDLEAKIRAEINQELIVQGSLTHDVQFDLSGLSIEEVEKLLEIQNKLKRVDKDESAE